MAGYSHTPLSRKLGIKQGHTVVLIDPPNHFPIQLEPLPPGTRLTPDIASSREADIILLFCRSELDLHRHLKRSANMLVPTGGLWVAWPKKSSGYRTDLDFNRVQLAGLGLDLVDNKICAVDDTFSGLRFVVRVENRIDWAAGRRL